jgi:hypothetical protein
MEVLRLRGTARRVERGNGEGSELTHGGGKHVVPFRVCVVVFPEGLLAVIVERVVCEGRLFDRARRIFVRGDEVLRGRVPFGTAEPPSVDGL